MNEAKPSPPPIPDDTSEQSTASSQLARIALRGTVWSSLGNYLNLLVSFGTTLILTRLISPEVFGAVALAAFWAGLLSMRSKAGLLYAASHQSETNGDLLGTYLVVDLCSSALSLVVAVVASLLMLVANLMTLEVAVAVFVMLSAEALMVVAGPWQMALEKELQISRLTIITLLASISASAVAILLAIASPGIASLLVMSVVTAIISAFGIIITGRRRLPHLSQLRWKFNRALAKDMLADGFSAGISLALLVSIVGQFDNFLIGTFVGKETLGYYDRAYRIATWPNILLTVATARIGLQMMTRLRNDPSRLAHAIRLWFWLATSLGIPLALVLCFGSSEIVGLLYGSRYAQSADYLRFLSLSNLAWAFISIAFWLSVALGNRRVSIVLSLVQAITLIVVATPLTFRFGVMGTMAGVGTSMALAMLLGCRYIFATVSLKLGEVFGAALAAGTAVVIVLLVVSHWSEFMSFHSAIRLIVIAATTFGVFVGTLLLLRKEETIDRVLYLARAWNRAK